MTVSCASLTSVNLVDTSLIEPEVVTNYLLGTDGAFDTFSATDVINTMAYSPYLSAIVTIDHENTIKSYSLSPSTLGRGHALLDPGGPVWVSLFDPPRSAKRSKG